MIGEKAKMTCRIKTKEDLELELATMKLMLYSMYDTFEELLRNITGDSELNMARWEWEENCRKKARGVLGGELWLRR